VALIVEQGRAERLARAIVSDIVLYHEAELREASPQLTSAIDEGRELFRARVEPSLHAVFERALAERNLTAASVSERVALQDYRGAAHPVGPPEPQSSGTGVPLLLALAALAVAAYFFLR